VKRWREELGKYIREEIRGTWMAENSYEPIWGTVMQRSFIASELADIIHIATVPISEVVQQSQLEDVNLLRYLTAEIVGVPSSYLIDDLQYTNITRLVSNPDTFREIVLGEYNDDFAHMWRESLHK
jgi:hypothetical protein